MVWIRCSFGDALREFLKAYERQPSATAMALVWRAGGEYNVMDGWLLKRIMADMDEEKLRVVLWLDREETVQMINMVAGGV